jgi:hypothetical protein
VKRRIIGGLWDNGKKRLGKTARSKIKEEETRNLGTRRHFCFAGRGSDKKGRTVKERNGREKKAGENTEEERRGERRGKGRE